MKIFKISQNVNNDYDTYDSAIVVAENEEEARRIHPNNDGVGKIKIYYDEEKKEFWNTWEDDESEKYEGPYGSWTNEIDKIKVEYIGEARKGAVKGCILASFNAG